MSNTKLRLGRLLVAGSLITAALGAGAGPASADPNPTNPGTPPTGLAANKIVATVGADAFAEHTNYLASEYNADNPLPAPQIASYDSINPVTGVANETITSKPGCAFPRPNGANAGLTAIKLNTTSTADPSSFCIDFVRSSRSKAATGEGNLNFYTFGGDAISWATVGNSYAPRTPLTQTQLKGIFECTITDWSQVGGQKGAIRVYTPAAGAATLTVFLAGIGSSIAAVTSGCGSAAIPTQQNDGTKLLADPQAIVPYTVSKWGAQKNNAPGILDLRGGTVVGLYNDTTAPLVTTTFGGQEYTAVNPSFVSSPAGRLFYYVTRKPAVAGDPDPLAPIFSTSGYLCSQEQALLVPFGIATLGTNTAADRYCGQVT